MEKNRMITKGVAVCHTCARAHTHACMTNRVTDTNTHPPWLGVGVRLFREPEQTGQDQVH